MAYTRAVFALSAILPLLSSTAAFAKPIVVLTLSQATVQTAADGVSHLAALNDTVPVARGVAIRYTISAKDLGSDPARHLALTGHVPAGTAYVQGSVRGPGGHAEFSLDGKSFSAHPMITVKTAAGDVIEPADAALYVMVRWVKDGPLAAKSVTAFSYDVQVQ